MPAISFNSAETSSISETTYYPQTNSASPTVVALAIDSIAPNPFSISIYGDPEAEITDLVESVRTQGVLVPLVVALRRGEGSVSEPGATVAADFDRTPRWELISGHRRWACARFLELSEVPCEIRSIGSEADRRRAVLEYNRQRRKTFSQLMREADALEEILGADGRTRRLGNLRVGTEPGEGERSSTESTDFSEFPDRRNSDDREIAEPNPVDPTNFPDRRNSDDREIAVEAGGRSPSRSTPKRTDAFIARQIGLGGKDTYRHARAVWRAAQGGDARGISGVSQLDAETKSIHAAYKDLRRRGKYTAGFRPTPYDVWSFRHDRAFGIPHPGAIPAGIIAHALYYFSPPGGLVVDPMAGGGTTVDVCTGMGRRCLAYDLRPTRPEIQPLDVAQGLPPETVGCDLIFCDPPYHTMLADEYPADSVASAPLSGWIGFLDELARSSFSVLRPGGHLALLLAPQTEKDIPAGFGYVDHSFFGYGAGLRAGFVPIRRISCPMSGGHLPQQVRRARLEGRLLGQVRDLLVFQKPSSGRPAAPMFPHPQDAEIPTNTGYSKRRPDCQNDTMSI